MVERGIGGSILRMQMKFLRFDRGAGAPRDIRYSCDGYNFELRIVGKHQGAFEFTWRQTRGAPLPPLRGTLEIRRLGPLRIYTLDVHFIVAGGASGRLLIESVADTLARRSVGYLARSISHACTA